jgi:4-amino-4-deoxy-L-arabinose transferase-like glycosyltransferase
LTVTSQVRWLRANAPEVALLVVCVGRLWLMAMPSSLWTDETATAFVARYPGHPSLAIVPPYTQSIYYALPRAMDALFGFSEIAYRIPSVLAMLVALLFVARLTARLVHPDAAWFAVFACLAIPGIDYFAIDAKPYALGMCVATGALYYLVRWLDSARWWHALFFLAFAAVLWRVHQVYWPFYLVFGLYSILRAARRETRVTPVQILAVFAVLGLALAPVALDSLQLLREATTHVFVARPPLLELRRLLRSEWDFIAVCGGLAWLASRLLRWQSPNMRCGGDVLLMAAWWLLTPLTIFLFSQLSSTSLFVPRYLSLHLPGLAVTATMAAAIYIPRGQWRPAILAMAVGALLFNGNWKTLWPEHDPAGWRPAAEYANRMSAGPETPILCTSPFIEAVPPVWREDYPLPGFLYAQLFAYPMRGKPYLLPYHPDGPFRPPEQARQYAVRLSAEILPRYDRFLVYGGIRGVQDWREWLANTPQLRGWRNEERDFGDIRVIVFSR